MDTIEFLKEKYNLDLSVPLPVEIPNIGRNNLGEIFKELGFKVGVEMGTESGIFSEILCQGNPGMKLFSVDAWTAYSGYREHVSQEKVDEIYEEAKKRLSPYNCDLVKAFSTDAVKKFKDESLDFVYIDGNHTYESVSEDIAIWAPKVRTGGIVAGHDFFTPANNAVMKFGVIQAVREYMLNNKINPWFLIGRSAKIPGEIRDNSRSWMFVKK